MTALFPKHLVDAYNAIFSGFQVKQKMIHGWMHTWRKKLRNSLTSAQDKWPLANDNASSPSLLRMYINAYVSPVSPSPQGKYIFSSSIVNEKKIYLSYFCKRDIS